MNKSFTRNLLAAGALLASVAIPATASAATMLFGLTGLTIQSGAGFNFTTQTVTVGAETVKVRISAWSLSGTSGNGTVSSSTLGSFGSGLGAISGGETATNTHTLDNQISRDFLVFQFDKSVKLVDALFTPFALAGNAADTDFTVGVGTTATAWNVQPALNGMTNAALTTMFGGSLAHYVGSNVANTKALNPSGTYGNMWMIGASFNNPDTVFDSYKLKNVTAVTAPVPESATWMMMIAGFGIVGATMRRKAAAVRAVA